MCAGWRARGASHASIATSSGSGPGGYRSGSFVHPFQQTPRTSTPPLSYANSLASLDQPTQQGNNNSRDYSPTITEDEDLDFDPSYSYNHPANGLQPQSRSLSQNNLHNYAANTNTAGNTSNSSRLANVSSTSDLNLLSESYDSPGALSLATSPPSSSTPAFSPHSFTATSPVSLSTSASAMGLRTLLEGFRLRSRSELGSDYHQERIRIERQKWQDKERAKQQKRLLFLVFAAARGDHHRTESDARDQQVEAAAEALIKARAAALDDGLDDHTFIRSDTAVESTYGGASFAEFKELPRRARSSEERRRTRKKTAAASVPRSNRGQCSVVRYSLKSVPTFAARGYASVAAQGVAFETPPRGRTAKRKTQSAWTTFTLWFKSLLLKSKRQ
ncbi:hypothetical protein BN1723_013949, partial [Verticillium longisporum]